MAQQMMLLHSWGMPHALGPGMREARAASMPNAVRMHDARGCPTSIRGDPAVAPDLQAPTPAGVLPFSEAQLVASSLELATQQEWRARCNSSIRPANFPCDPGLAYLNHGWRGNAHWLGTGQAATCNVGYLPFETACVYARTLKLKTAEEWHEWSESGARPANIPRRPEQAYRQTGWRGYDHWLGARREVPALSHVRRSGGGIPVAFTDPNLAPNPAAHQTEEERSTVHSVLASQGYGSPLLEPTHPRPHPRRPHPQLLAAPTQKTKRSHTGKKAAISARHPICVCCQTVREISQSCLQAVVLHFDNEPVYTFRVTDGKVTEKQKHGRSTGWACARRPCFPRVRCCNVRRCGYCFKKRETAKV